MKKKSLSALFLVVIIVFVNSMSPNIYAETVDSENSIGITPYYATIVLCYNNLEQNTKGILSCEGETSVQTGYIAGVKLELQKLSGIWTTIKTWESTSKDNEMYLYKKWHIEKGTYRLKSTHTALNSFGKVVETVTKYSATVTY